MNQHRRAPSIRATLARLAPTSVGLICALMLTGACGEGLIGPAGDDEGTRTTAIHNGTPTAGYPYVIKLWNGAKPGPDGFPTYRGWCSAVVVGRRGVVTGKHCFPNSTALSFEDPVFGAMSTRRIHRSPVSDVILAVFDRDISIPPAQIVAPPERGSGSIVGYGPSNYAREAADAFAAGMSVEEIHKTIYIKRVANGTLTFNSQTMVEDIFPTVQVPTVIYHGSGSSPTGACLLYTSPSPRDLN